MKISKKSISIFAIFLIAIGSSINAYASFDKIDDKLSINISGGNNFYNVNIYTPDENLNLSLNKTIKVPNDNSLSINNFLASNNLTSLSNINDIYSFTGNWYLDENLTNEVTSDYIISNDINLYSEYVGYFVKGNNQADYVPLTIKEDNIRDALTPIIGKECYIYQKTIRLNSEYELVANYMNEIDSNANNLYTESGMYRVNFNILNNELEINRYIVYKAFDQWWNDGAYVIFQGFMKESDGFPNPAPYENNLTISPSLTYEIEIPASYQVIRVIRCNTLNAEGRNIYNNTDIKNFPYDIEYSYSKFYLEHPDGGWSGASMKWKDSL